MEINWEYCECGCKSYRFSFGGISWSLYWDLKDGWYLSTKDSMTYKKFSSKEEANKAVLVVMRKHIKKMKDELKRIGEL